MEPAMHRFQGTFSMTFGLRVLSAAAAAAFGCLVATSASALTTTVEWIGQSDFDSSTSPILLPLQASKLVSFSGPGTYGPCCSSGVTTFNLDLQLDGAWVNVLTWQ